MTDQDLQQLRSLVPLHTLSEEGFSELTAETRVEAANRGHTLFREGDTDNENIYLLDGQLALKENNRVVEQVSAGSNTARFPIGHQLPRKFTAQVTSGARFVRIDSRRLSDVLAREHTVDYQVNDLDDDSANDDWMTQLLQSRVLQQIPASNIQRVMMKVEQLEVTAGEIVIRQGEPGDYYYMLNRGKAVVSRDSTDGGPPIELARLGPGTSFGEEALLSNSPRNSTITMLTDGLLLRLSKHDFVQLIHHPLAERHEFAEASELVDNGALWLDVRRTEDFESGHLPGSLNLPFDSLRYQVTSLAPDRRYVLVSDNGNAAAAAAFLLLERGFEVSVLHGGYDTVQQQATRAQADDLDDVDEQEHPTAPLVVDEAVEAADSERVLALEERIRDLELEQGNAGAERQASLHHLKDAIDKARRRMLAVDQERKAAIKERDQLSAEAEQIARKLQAAELEREGMRQSLADFEQKEQVWQERLRKAEAHGIGERDKAESASQRLEQLERQLKASRQDQMDMREANARQTGELKEELTAFQLDLEQLRSDYEALQAVTEDKEAQLTRVKTQSADLEQAAKELERRCEQAMAEAEASAKQLDELRRISGDGDAATEQLAGQLKAMEQQLSDRDEVLAAREQALDQVRNELQAAADRIQQTEAELQQAQSRASAQAQARETLEKRLAEVNLQQSEVADQSQELATQLRTAQTEREQLEAARAHLEETKRGLEQELAAARETLAGREAELQGQLAEAAAASNALRVEKEEVLQTLKMRDAELIDARDRVVAQEAEKQVSDAERAAQKAEIEALERQVQDVQAATSATIDKFTDAERATAVEREQADAKLAELSLQIEETVQARAAAEADLTAKHQEIEQLYADLQAANQRNDETNARLQDATQGFDDRQQRLTADMEAAQAALVESLRAAQAEQLAQLEQQLAAQQAQHADELAQNAAALKAAEQAQQVADAELATLRMELEQVQSASEAYQARLSDNERALTQQQGEAHEELSAKLRASEEKIAQQAVDLAAREQDLNALAAELQAARAASIAFEARQCEWDAMLGQTKALAEQRDAEAAALRQDNAALRGRFESADQAQRELAAEVAAAAATLEEQQAEAVREVTELQQRLTQLEAAHQALIGERDRLATNLAAVEKELDRMSVLQDHADGLAQELQEALAARQDAEQSLIAWQQGHGGGAAAQEALQRQLEDAQRDAEVHGQAVVDLEQTLEDMRAEYAAELTRRDAEGQALRDRLSALQNQALDVSPSESGEGGGLEWQLRYDDLKNAQSAVAEERDAARIEVQELRSVIEKYVDQIKAIKDAGPDELAALTTELAMVREQAAQDVQKLHDALDKARLKIKDLERPGSSHDPLSAEALRQEVSSLKDALAERQRELSMADKNRQQIEDELEDAAREIERLKREAAIDMSQMLGDHAPNLPNSAFQTGRQATDPADVIDDLLENGLRDARITPPRRTVDIADVTGSNRAGQIALGVLVGLVLVLGGLELALFLSGRGELFGQLFGGG